MITIKYLKVREVKQSIDQNESDGTSSISDNYDTRKQEITSTSSSPSSPDKDHHRFSQPKPKKVYLDIKGTVLLGTSITFLLLGLSYLIEDNKGHDSNDIVLENANIVLALVFLAVSIISIITFIKIEQKADSPLLDIKFIASWKIFPLLLVFLIMGFTMFMIYQTIPILVKAPSPIGFGGSSLTSSAVLLPFTIVFLIISPLVSKIISKFGNLRPFIVANSISLIGFAGIFVSHSDEFQVGLNLTVIATGLAMLNTIAMNVILLITPKNIGGVVVGVVQVFIFTGMALGPIISGLYMQNYQTQSMDGLEEISLPSSEAYQLIFLTAVIASCISLAMAIIIIKKVPSEVIKI